MPSRLISLNINSNIGQYIQESIQNTDVDGSGKHSLDFIYPSDTDGQQSIITDYVRASTGGTFYGYLYLAPGLTSFSGQQIPTSQWVLDRIEESIQGGGIDFDSLFDNRFNLKSISDLGTRNHSMLTNINGNGDIHLSQSEVGRVRTAASSSTDGYLKKEDWSLFNSKLSTINVSTGLRYQSGVLSLMLNQIDHNQLLNYDSNRHLPKNDNATDSNSLWSASKIISYVQSNIPQEVTDFVSKSNGGVFEGVVSYSLGVVPSNPSDLVTLSIVEDGLQNLYSDIFTALRGSGDDSISNLLAYASLSDIQYKDHSMLTSVQGGSESEQYHLTLSEYNRVINKADSSTDGYLSKEDWVLFNSKLGSFTVSLDTEQEDFLRYDSGIMYYNPTKIDHDSLLGYDPNRHPLLDDNSVGSDIVWSSEKINSMLTSTDFQSYRIKLNSGATVEQRLVGLVEGVDYPTGWVLSADGSALVITHNKDTVATTVSVFSVNGTTGNAVKLEGNVAYSTFTNEFYNSGYNRIRLDAFATTPTSLIIKILL